MAGGILTPASPGAGAGAGAQVERTVARLLEQRAQAAAIGVAGQRLAAIGPQRDARTGVGGPACLVSVGVAEEVIAGEALLDRRAQHFGAQHEPRRQARARFVKAGLDEHAGAGKGDAEVGGDRLAVELQQIQAQPATGRGPLGIASIQLVGRRFADDGGAVATLPARRLQREERLEVAAQRVRSAAHAKGQLSLAFQATPAPTNLRAQRARRVGLQLLEAVGQRQPGRERSRHRRDLVALLGQLTLGGLRSIGIGEQPLQRDTTVALGDQRADQLGTRLRIAREHVPVWAVHVRRGRQAPRAVLHAGAGADRAVAVVQHRPAKALAAERLAPTLLPLVGHERRAGGQRERVPLVRALAQLGICAEHRRLREPRRASARAAARRARRRTRRRRRSA